MKEILKDNGWSNQQIEATLYYKPSFFRRRVPRIALPPRQLYYRVRAVFVTFGSRKDSKSSRPLFDLSAWKGAKNLLKEIQQGYYSDPPGVNFYTFELDAHGEIKKDRYGIELLKCSRGTSLTENGHKNYNATFRHRCGIELGDTLLRERRHRQNMDIAIRNYREYPQVGHYDTWDIDLLQTLVEQNLGKLIFPSWQRVSDYIDTPESLVTVPIHDPELHQALIEKWEELRLGGFEPDYTPDVEHLFACWGVPMPFLPVMKKEEFSYFSRIILSGILPIFDAEAMALEWMKEVDGQTIFPKLPSQLRDYYKKWERNQRIKDATEAMENDQSRLDRFMRRHVPMQIEQRRESANDDGKSDDEDFSMPTIQVEHENETYPWTKRNNLMPLARNQPLPDGMRRQPGTGAPVVNNETIAPAVGLPGVYRPRKRGVGDRGIDKTRRQKRSCFYCMESWRLGRKENAASCPGKRYRRDCPIGEETEPPP